MFLSPDPADRSSEVARKAVPHLPHRCSYPFLEATFRSDAQSEAAVVNAERAIALIRLQRLRFDYFGEKLFLEPIWPMLLDLFEGFVAEKVVAVSSLYQIPGVPISTALRRIDDLETAELISRYPDPSDRRRTLVRLTEKGQSRLQAYFRSLSVEISKI